jgi:hypothetical protein
MKSLLMRCVLLLAVASGAAFAATPQSTAFTYQGSLSANGQPANGNVDLTFALFDAATNGNQVGSTLTQPQYPVAQGLFTIDLNFPGAFTGNQLWLQVTVNGTPVLPRQAVNTTPVAQYALSGSTSGQNVHEVYGTGQLVVNASMTSYTLIPGLTQTINVPPNSVVHVRTDGGAQSTGATSSTYSVVDIALFVDGVVSINGGQRRLSIANTSSLAQLIANWSMSRTYTLSPGNHTFEVRAVSVSPGASTVNVSSGTAPQLMGVLTVMVINR